MLKSFRVFFSCIGMETNFFFFFFYFNFLCLMWVKQLVQIWPPKSVKDSGSRLHSKLKEAILQVTYETGTIWRGLLFLLFFFFPDYNSVYFLIYKNQKKLIIHWCFTYLIFQKNISVPLLWNIGLKRLGLQ
jgi:hypothetical protein